ncbi:cystathionine gamma-synthase [Emcibacter sp.]|uniref:cystathionine gamma-synthase n=1 Tax=Emcibacter sp. TaxID=1979954 RepID=UPI003A8DC44A
MTKKEPGLVSDETMAATWGVASDKEFGAVAPPLYLTSTFEFEGFDHPRMYDYGRAGNPSRELLASALTKLEQGAGTIITSSGMSAVDLLLGQFGPNDLILAPHDCYGGTRRLLLARSALGHFRIAFVDQGNETALLEALKEEPALVFVETPSNPLMRIVDISDIAFKSKAIGALVAVDNTFLSPARQKPLTLGADFVLHSTTKYLNGHSDVIGGAIIAADRERFVALQNWANIVGTSGAPFDSWLTLRGLRTLFPRMKCQEETAGLIAEFLDNHANVRAVYYPGLLSHPGHAIAKKQQQGYGAMLSFELEGGVKEVRSLVRELRLFTLAESLGGVESLVSHPVTMTHADMDPEARKVAGISDSLIRLSVGLESAEDLIEDMGRALKLAG